RRRVRLNHHSFPPGFAAPAAAPAEAEAEAPAPDPPDLSVDAIAAAAAARSATLVVCPLNSLVGANSPSLCPTMFSVMYTGMNFLPLCTASVCPMNSGRMVDRRDHVRTTFFSFFSFIAAPFTAKWSSVKGPFFRDLPIVSALSLLRLAAHYVLVGALVVARLEPARRLARGSPRMASSGSLAFAAAMRMVHWIHGYTAVM